MEPQPSSDDAAAAIAPPGATAVPLHEQDAQRGVIGSYTLDGPLGAGGMGAVYRARNQQSGAPVALKIAARADPIVVDSVRREIRLLSRIRHPGVVALVDHGLHELRPWYAMELIEGEAIADFINRLWSRPPRKKTPVPDTEERAIREMAAEAARAEELETRPMRATVPGIPNLAAGKSSSPGGASTLEDDEPPPAELRPQAAAGKLAEVVQLFARLCQTLGYLHGEGIVHLDLKPTNILLRADGQPCVVDFGITREIAGGLNREVLNVDPLQGGTEHYMAPEQIMGGRTDARTDLYGLGCMLYEALTGRPPFLRTPAQSVGEQHLKRAPKPPSAWVQGIVPELDAGVLRLLEKQSEKRMGYAGDLLDLLCRLGARIDPELAVRKPKPYLYRPRLVGRDALMEQLRVELDRAERGQGRCVYLLGASGAGKTRVAMELGRDAFAADMRVVSGECAPVTLSATAHSETPVPSARDAAAGQARPLQPFQALLSTLVDLCNAGGPEATKALVGDALPVLENLEPMLAKVPGRDQFPPKLSMSAAGSTSGLGAPLGRVEQALAATIVAMARSKPLLLVIDDLQWADALSQAVLRTLGATSVEGSRVCVLVTCRADELTPEIEALLPPSASAKNAVRYDVGPLEKRDVASIIAGMIAHDDAPTELVQMIGDRSGGNPFFVAEYLHAAVSAGKLRRDAQGRWTAEDADGSASGAQLPSTPSELLAARFKALEPITRSLLEMAAVLGRAVPRAALRKPSTSGASGEWKTPSFEEIEELISRGILVEDGATRLRFSHDKLREAAYAGIPDEMRRTLHRMAAEQLRAITLPPESNVVAELEREALLAHHTRAAEMHAEHLRHAWRAGELANRAGAHRQSAALLKEALHVTTAHPDAASTLGSLELARIWSTYGTVLENLGHVEEGVPALEKALASLGHTVPPSGAGLVGFIAAQLSRHLSRRLMGAPTALPDGAQRNAVVEAAETAAALARGYVGTNRQLNIIAAVLLSANLAEEGRADGPIVHSHAFLAGIAGLLGMQKRAVGYFERAREAAARNGTLEAALTLAQIEGFYYMSRAEWTKASATMQPILERSVAAGALHLAEPPLLTLNYVHMLQGDLPKATEYAKSLLEITKKTGNERFFLVGQLALSLHEMYRGELEPALARIEALDDRVGRFDEFIHIANFHATRAGLLSWLGRHVEAVDYADKAVALLANTGARNALLYNVHAFVPETYLRAWANAKESSAQDAVATSFADRARKAITGCGQFSGVCEYARPMFLRFRGTAALLSGAQAKAARLFEKSAIVATRHANPFEVAMAARALASFEHLDAAERKKWRDRAREKFTTLGNERMLVELS